ncbi:hypothetical protein JHK82_041422 [Glycine max]|uniref:Thionin-like protein n=1 Tax=Glycine max TaxID=3847 RepID=I1MDS8_SOYBN|nr:hypothetical protein JHK87_041371 [Glycine soja]KAG4948240.1 hypothetical protein JHK86_041479 [Glycine max]KAG4955707.1 hypothetical protein JHK85_042087 [Glycine max]KAG5104452.1 hypothetical protein JHK82_041422 [Glycine max]KAG5115575.1 hypothetical protein JHK84_041688 [Glycine max]
MKKMVVAMMLIFLLISTQMESVEPDAADCLDGCTTACVQSDSRLQARCDRKCSIRCGPGNQPNPKYFFFILTMLYIDISWMDKKKEKDKMIFCLLT